MNGRLAVLLLAALPLAACHPPGPRRCTAPPRCVVVDRIEGPRGAAIAVLCDEDRCTDAPAGTLTEGQSLCGGAIDDRAASSLRRRVESAQDRLRSKKVGQGGQEDW